MYQHIGSRTGLDWKYMCEFAAPDRLDLLPWWQCCERPIGRNGWDYGATSYLLIRDSNQCQDYARSDVNPHFTLVFDLTRSLTIVLKARLKLQFAFPICSLCGRLLLKVIRDFLVASRPCVFNMPPVRSARNRKPPPDGFDDIEDTLLEFSNKMKDAENASHEGKKRHEVMWPIFQISHQRMSAIKLGGDSTDGVF